MWEEGKKAEYWGESTRNGFCRGKEHIKGLKNENKKAPLWRHASAFHGGEKKPEWYKMKVEKVHRTPLVRQVAEGVEIATCDADVIMNSKGEWNGSKLPRMVIERGDKHELDKDDVNVRMMNWEETVKVKNITKVRTEKRKVREEEVSEVIEDN